MFGFSQEDKNRALRDAVREDDVYRVRLLLDKGADPNARDEADREFTIMERTVRRGDLSILQALAARGGKLVGPQGKDDPGTLLHLANHTHVICYLLENGADADIAVLNHSGKTPIEGMLEEFSWKYHHSVEDKKRIFNAYFTAAEKYGAANPLLTGSRNMRFAVLAMATQAMADDAAMQKVVDACKDTLNVESDGVLPLQVAAAAGNVAAIKMLIAAGADVNAVSGDKKNAAHSARNPETLACLIDAGVNLEQVDKSGHTPVMAAIERGDQPTATALMEKNVNLKRCDKEGIPYVCRAARGDMSIFRAMLEHEADLGVEYPAGKSIIDVICQLTNDNNASIAAMSMLGIMQKRQSDTTKKPAAPVQQAPVSHAEVEDGIYRKLSDTSILVQNGGGFSSMFNFASGQVTEMKDGVPYLTQNFNALGRRELVDEMRQKLVALNGAPPAPKASLVIKD